MKPILVIGGTGFLGRAVVHALTLAGEFAIAVPTRRRERNKHLAVLPSVTLVEADVHDTATLTRLMQGCHAVINLVGILHSPEGLPYGSGFAHAHVALPEKIVAAAKTAGVRRLLHVSALQASPQAPSGYLRSKAAGEAVIQTSDLAWTIFQPSVIFGREDAFLNVFARLASVVPVFPLACATARFQPVWVNDVAATLVASLTRHESIGKVYPLCGPERFTLAELVHYASAWAGHPRPIVPLPNRLAWAQTWLMEWLPNPLMSRDNLRSMQVDNVCPTDCTLPFNRQAGALTAIAPSYLAPKR